MLIMRDISNFMNTFITMMSTGIATTFDTLKNLTFARTNALEVLIVINILGVFIPVLLTIVNNQGVSRVKSDIKQREKIQRSKK